MAQGGKQAVYISPFLIILTSSVLTLPFLYLRQKQKGKKTGNTNSSLCWSLEQEIGLGVWLIR